MHDAVKQVMRDTDMLRKAADACAVARSKGCKVIIARSPSRVTARTTRTRTWAS